MKNDTASEEIFLSRRPIFDAQRRTKGYQVSSSAEARHEDAQAVRLTIGAAVNVVGLDQLVDTDHILFFRVDAETIVEEEYAVLPPEKTVLILAAPGKPVQNLLSACRAAKNAGYKLAVDQHVVDTCGSDVLESAGLFAADFGGAAMDKFPCNTQGLAGLAINVESQDSFDRATKNGFGLVQGFFFSAPAAVSGRTPSGFAGMHHALLQETSKASPDMGRIEQIVNGDPSLAYKLLKHINSAAMGLRQQVTSVRHAIVLLGERRIKRWGLLTALSSVASKKPHELLLNSVVRSRFCEELSILLGKKDSAEDMFLTGLLSAMDAIMDLPMEQVAKGLAVNDEVRAGMLRQADHATTWGVELACACERGAWETGRMLCAKAGFPQHEAVSLYYKSLSWSRQDLRE